MSKRKRNVAFLKPDEPAFITRMKAAAGYKEGPTVDTKVCSRFYLCICYCRFNICFTYLINVLYFRGKPCPLMKKVMNVTMRNPKWLC